LSTIKICHFIREPGTSGTFVAESSPTERSASTVTNITTYEIGTVATWRSGD